MRRTFLTLALVTSFAWPLTKTHAQNQRALWGSINGTKNASLGDYQRHTGKVLISWRMLPSDNAQTAFDLYRRTGNSSTETKIASNIQGSTNWQDTTADKTQDNHYRLTYAGETATLATYTLPAA